MWFFSDVSLPTDKIKFSLWNSFLSKLKFGEIGFSITFDIFWIFFGKELNAKWLTKKNLTLKKERIFKKN